MTRREITAIANAATATKGKDFVSFTYKKGTFECSYTSRGTLDEDLARREWIEIITYRHNHAIYERRKRNVHA